MSLPSEYPFCPVFTLIIIGHNTPSFVLCILQLGLVASAEKVGTLAFLLVRPVQLMRSDS